MLRKPPALATAAVGLVTGATLVGGVAVATTTTAASIKACANKKTGALRLAPSCTTKERKVTWAVRGPQGPAGPAGATGAKGATGTTGTTGAAGTSVFASTVPAGTTITGAWGGRYIAPQLSANNSYLIVTSFPVKAPAPISDLNVNAAPNANAGDPDTTCTGTADAPTAPPGKVCIYISTDTNAQITGFRMSDPGNTGTSPADAWGFTVRMLDEGTVGNTAALKAFGTWAYTAPTS